MRLMTRVIVLLILGTLSLAKTIQPIFVDSYEGQEVNISCSHTNITTNEYIFWYRQFPNQGPQFVIQGYKTNVANEVASLIIPADRKSSTLILPWATLKDTAVYYCILGVHSETDGAAHLCSISLWGGSHITGKAPK
uniref:T cell receptor alpha variable 4 n=2 Tax=Sus scrofa TaxID=9823 RepID=A0A287AKB0_PIG